MAAYLPPTVRRQVAKLAVVLLVAGQLVEDAWADKIPQDVWDECYADGLIRLGVVGVGDVQAIVTEQGDLFVRQQIDYTQL